MHLSVLAAGIGEGDEVITTPDILRDGQRHHSRWSNTGAG